METKAHVGERVGSSTAHSQNQKIDSQTKRDIAEYKDLDSASIQRRLRELDGKWDIERTLILNAAVLSLSGAMLALLVNKRWAIMPAVVSSFLVQHSLQGWCPPLPLLKMLGLKSRAELDREKYALKSLRGDFKHVNDIDKAWRAVIK